MSVNFADISVRILKDTHSQVIEKLNSKRLGPTELSETVRIIALSKVLRYWLSDLGEDPNGCSLKELSPTGFRNHVDSDMVQTLTSDLLPEMSELDESNNVPNLNPLALVDLIGTIHTIGSHTIPPRGFSIKRLQGAFYTPSQVAYFIAQRTINPVLESRWISCKKDVESFLNDVKQMRFLDPCCGPGIFLICAMEVIKSKLEEYGIAEQLTLSNIYSQFYGVDIDPAALEIAQICMKLAAGENGFVSDNDKDEVRFCIGNSIINLIGQNGINYEHFFKNHESRQPFEWITRFPSVFKRGGFDFILFNPPYERLKPNLAEFMRENLKSGNMEINLQEYESYKALMREDLNYYRSSGEFRYTTFSSMNIYQLFIERAIQICKSGGRIGFIVPSTILGDFSSKNLRKHLLFNNSIRSVDEFNESARLFPGVTQSVCVAIIEKGGESTSISLRHGLESLNETKSSSPFQVSLKGIVEVFGEQYSIPRVNAIDWRILQKMHLHPSISSYSWLMNHRGELDLTMDKRFIVSNANRNELIRGRAIGRYSLITDSDSQDKEYVDITAFKKSKRNSKRVEHLSEPRIACQQVSNLNNKWRLKFARINPNMVLANSCNYFAVSDTIPSFILDYLLGVMNSHLLNWRFFVSSTNNHVSNRELSLLPIVDPFDKKNCKLIKEISSRVNRVRKHSPDGIPEIESLIFKLYGISPSSAKRILEIRRLSQQAIQRILDEI